MLWHLLAPGLGLRVALALAAVRLRLVHAQPPARMPAPDRPYWLSPPRLRRLRGLTEARPWPTYPTRAEVQAAFAVMALCDRVHAGLRRPEPATPAAAIFATWWLPAATAVDESLLIGQRAA